MKRHGFIRRTHSTYRLWRKLARAKGNGDTVEVGRLSDLIRRRTIRGANG